MAPEKGFEGGRMYRVAVRVDASKEIGSGHVMRCLTLARLLRERGAEVYFICRDHPHNLCDFINSDGFRVQRLAATRLLESGHSGESPHRDWLGTSSRRDAAESREAFAELGTVDWLIVDHYAIADCWEEEVGSAALRTLVIDDLADRRHDCDLLLDQNFHEEAEKRYSKLLTPECLALLGPQYALLRPEFSVARSHLRTREGGVHSIFISFGGVDPTNETEKVVRAFLRLGLDEIHADVVVGTGNPNLSRLEELCRGRVNLRLHRHVATMAQLMSEADLAIGAGGATTWERCCLGLPSLVMTTAANQEGGARALGEAGYITLLGGAPSLDVKDLERAILSAIGEGAALAARGAKCMELVDGLGAIRVLRAMCEVGPPQLRLRPARSFDKSLYFDWVNDPEVRSQALNGNQISQEEHAAWFDDRIGSVSALLLVAETTSGLPVGQVRFDRFDHGWRLDYSLDKKFRGLKLAAQMLKLALDHLFDSAPGAKVFAEVKLTNSKSRRALESVGFALRSQVPGEVNCFECSRE